MKYYKIECEDKKGGININPTYEIPTIPYKILDSTTDLILNNKFVISKGTKLYDVLPFEKHFGNIAISRKLKNYLESKKISGWSCFPIEIKGIEEQYFAFQVLGKSGKIINLDNVNTSFEKPVKRQIIASTIDGSDIFVVEETLNVLIKEDLANDLKKEGFTNLIVQDIENSFEFI
ncbi:MAG: hypothetical protein PHQ74_05760 [Crocinitomicaceae bacterium]|nr:hypothetical protein [Crocinitomicaceae bacterium]